MRFSFDKRDQSEWSADFHMVIVGMGDSFRRIGMLIVSLDLHAKANADEFAVAEKPNMLPYRTGYTFCPTATS